jgi:pyruvate/2-oxoglutarate dehydrogenase complex dihydrolipoamide acyltransferase (E2) component
MALPPVNRRANEFGNINRTLSPEFKTDWDAVRAKDAEIKAYLGTTDYSAQNQEANDLAKLQFALSLMGRGFASMGAAPQPGENALGAVGRTLVAPLAGDISTISGPLMKQRAATRLAEQQEDRQRKMAAYTAVGASAKEQRALAEKLLGDPAKAAKPMISDTGVFQQITALSSDGVPKVGPQIATKAVFYNGKLRQYRVDTGTEIKVGDAIGNYRRYEKSTGTAATAKGTESPDFKATLAGYLSNLGGQQDRLGLGKFGIKFVPDNYDPAKGLDPSQENYPFARVDGQALTPAEKTKFTSQITNGYFNAFEAIKGGANLLNINKAFSESFFRQNVGQLGLRPAPAGPAPNPHAARTEAAVTAFYARAPRLFEQQGDVGEVLKGQPVPVRGQNFTAGIGKLKLASLAGVPFGPETNSPPPTASGQDVTIRAGNVKGMDRGNIQQRMTAESIAKGTSLAGKLSQSSTPRLDDQLQVVSKALADKTAALEKRQNDDASTQAAQLFSASLDAVARLDRMSVAAELSGVQGIIRGPAVGAGIKYLGTNFQAWFQN